MAYCRLSPQRRCPGPAGAYASSQSRRQYAVRAPARASERLTFFLIAGAILASGLLDTRLSLGGNIYPGDIFFAGIILVALPSLLGESRRSRGGRLTGPVLVFAWVMVLGYLIALIGVGVTGWAALQSLKNLLPPIVLVSVVALLEGRRALIARVFRFWTFAGVLVALSTIATSSGGAVRSTGTFSNPNYAAHYLCVALLVCMYSNVPRLLKIFAIGLMLVAMVKTGSFMSVLLLGGFLGYQLWKRLDRWDPRVRVVARLAVCTGATLIVVGALSSIGGTTFDYGSGLNAARLDKSYTSRLDIWSQGLRIFSDHPLGIGPSGLTNRSDISFTDRPVSELHNDTLDQLIDGGVLAVIGVWGIILVLWKYAPRGGMARTLLVGLILGSISRQTWNFRHAWLALAVALALDWLTQETRDQRRLQATSAGAPASIQE